MRQLAARADFKNFRRLIGQEKGWFRIITPYRIERRTPPSARKAAPLVAEESGLAPNATMAATSSGVANPMPAVEPEMKANLFSSLRFIP